MAARADDLDLGRLSLTSGEGRRMLLAVPLGALDFGGEHYTVGPALVDAKLDISRMTHGGYALRVRFTATLHGPCMRCLGEAALDVAVDAREIDQPGGGDDLRSPYVAGELLDLAAWARDALVLALPAQVLCKPDCAGLCPRCGADLNADPGHEHEPEPDPRWAALRELRLD